MAKKGYLEPKVPSPRMLRNETNGQFKNPPLYMSLGGMTSSSKLKRDGTDKLTLEKGGPSAKKGKPI